MKKYESHITLLKPKSIHDARILFRVANEHNMKTSWITGDPVMGAGKWFYINGYDTCFEDILIKVKSASKALKDSGFEVVREKIEQIIYDTKTGHFECGVDCFACLDT